MAAISSWNMNMYTVCFQTIALLSPMQSMEQKGTGSSAPNWDLFQLLSLQSMTSFMTTTRERDDVTRRIFFFGQKGGEGGILLQAQFLLQVTKL